MWPTSLSAKQAHKPGPRVPVVLPRGSGWVSGGGGGRGVGQQWGGLCVAVATITPTIKACDCNASFHTLLKI